MNRIDFSDTIYDLRLKILDKFYLPERKHRSILILSGYLIKFAVFIRHGTA